MYLSDGEVWVQIHIRGRVGLVNDIADPNSNRPGS